MRHVGEDPPAGRADGVAQRDARSIDVEDVVIDAKRRSMASRTLRPQVKLMNEKGEEVKIAGTDHSVNISFPVSPNESCNSKFKSYLSGNDQLAR